MLSYRNLTHSTSLISKKFVRPGFRSRDLPRHSNGSLRLACGHLDGTKVLLAATADTAWECVALRGDDASPAEPRGSARAGSGRAWVDAATGVAWPRRPGAQEARLLKKRSAARRANSTYIYDFPSLFRNALAQRWASLIESRWVDF